MTDRPEPANRRSGERRFAGVKAMVTHDQLGLTKCKLRDISLDGAFIETGTLVLSKNADVDLVLKIRAGSRDTPDTERADTAAAGGSFRGDWSWIRGARA